MHSACVGLSEQDILTAKFPSNGSVASHVAFASVLQTLGGSSVLKNFAC